MREIWGKREGRGGKNLLNNLEDRLRCKICKSRHQDQSKKSESESGKGGTNNKQEQSYRQLFEQSQKLQKTRVQACSLLLSVKNPGLRMRQEYVSWNLHPLYEARRQGREEPLIL